MKQISLSTSFIKGAVSVEQKNGSLRPWRLPCSRQRLFPSPENKLLNAAVLPSGVRVRIKTDACSIVLVVQPATEDRQFDLCIDTDIHSTFFLPAGDSEVKFTELPVGTKEVAIWLPPDVDVWLEALKVDDDAMVNPGSSEGKKWIAYGSSITHCKRCHSPAKTWPALVAREAGLDLTCLGLGGQCHLDIMIAREIREMPADLISLKLGINVYGNASLNPRTFKPAIIGFVETIREKHPNTPFVLISPIISPPKENEANKVGFTLEDMRQEVADATQRLLEVNRDKHLYYFDGRVLFGQELAHSYLPDNVHPDAEGGDDAASE